MTEAPTKDDAIRLREHLDAASSVREQLNCDEDYPEYPSAISELMRYITSSPWCNHHYKPTETKEILMRLDTADLDDIRSALTAVSRSERLCTGAWTNALADGRLDVLVSRAEQLIKEA